MKPSPISSQHLIYIQRPKLWIFSLVMMLLALIVIVIVSYEVGGHQAGFSRMDSDQQVEGLKQQIIRLSKQVDQLQRENTKLARDHHIDQDAGKQVSRTLADAQAEIMNMKEELTFYRNIVSPKKSKRSVQVKKVSVEPLAGSRYSYKVMLIQDGRHDIVMRGVVEMSLEGVQADGEQVRLALHSLSTKKIKKQQKFGFKYFQNFEGSIKIPPGFVPTSFFVRALPRSKKVPRVEEVFAWGDILIGGEQLNVGQTEKQN